MKKNFSALGEMWTILRFVGSFLWKADKRSLSFAVVLNIIEGSLIIPTIYLDKVFLDTLIANLQSPDKNLAITILLQVVGARLGVQLIQTLTRRMSGYYTRILHINRMRLAEVMVGQKYTKIAVPTIEETGFKDRYQKIQSEGFGKLQQITDNFLFLPKSASSVISALSVFYLGQPIVAALSLLSLIPGVVVDKIFIKRGYDLDSELAKMHRFRGAYSGQLSRGRSYMEVRLLNIHEYLGQKVTDIWNTVNTKRAAYFRASRTWGYLAGIVDDVVAYGLNGYFGIQAILGHITIGSAQAYVRAIAHFKSNASSLTNELMSLYECQLYIADLVWFFNLEEPYFNEKGAKIPDADQLHILFKDVWFKYPGSENWILKGVTIDIHPKQNIAIVGKNGAGKTTLIKLLCGFYEPTKGSITINGIKVSQINKPDYWKKISVLFQDFDMYSTSAKESIAIGNISQVNDLKRIQKYAKLSGIDDWISDLPKKYDNPLYRDFEFGVNPSSGQSQRIGLARALFKDPEILILDEPTSNVDPEAEEEIFHKILEVGKDKIIFFISHRFSTVRKADRIFVIQEGVVTESGSHEQLMKKKGEYAKLFTLQAKSYK